MQNLKIQMSRFLTILVCGVALCSSCIASTIDTGGSIRTRFESKQDFNFNDAEQDYFLTQIRFHFDWQATDNLEFYVELQDSRIFGESRTAVPPINEDAVPNIFSDAIDFHRVYLDYRFDGGKVRFGRQKLNLGDLRLSASLEWVNTARVWDGVRVTLGDAKTRKVDLFASRLVPVDPNNLNNWAATGNRYFDSEFHGAYVADKSMLAGREVQYWWMLRRNDRFNDNVHTLGARYLAKHGEWNFDIQGAMQFGDFDNRDHSAHMIHLAAERSLGAKATKVGIAYNLASGDSDATDNDHETFDNLYPLNHAYYGFMDLFSLQNVHNLEATYKTKLPGIGGLRIAYQGFWLNEEDTDAWYNAGLRPVRRATTDVDSYVGSEIDITLKRPFWNKKLVMVAGYSHFFSGSYLTDTGSDQDADFFFVQAKWVF